MLQRIALIVFLALGLGLIGFGLVYLTASEFMPYHSDAIQTQWANLDPYAQGLFLGLLRGLGGGALIAGTAATAMAWMSIRGTVKPYAALLPVVGIGYFVVLGYAIATVRALTPATPPMYMAGLGLGLAVIASFLLWVSRGTSK